MVSRLCCARLVADRVHGWKQLLIDRRRHRTLGVIFSSLAVFPWDSDPCPPSGLHPVSPTCDHAPDSSTSVLFKEKSKWEGKQSSLESELRDLHETVASLQSRLRQAELQKTEAQVKC